MKKMQNNKNDIIYTPLNVAKKMIEMCEITSNMTVLDPSKGGGVFYDNLPNYCIKDYCEITEEIDFFDNDKTYDLIIGNPPYSLWNKWIDHTLKKTDKFCYIFGSFNFTDRRVKKILDNGFGITKFHILKIEWWFSNSFIIVFERNKNSIITVEESVIICDKCNTRCGRGKNGKGSNICGKNN